MSNMSTLNPIFTLKKEDLSKLPKHGGEEDLKKAKLTFFESGYGSSKQAQGNHKVFRACLEDVYMDYKGKCRVDEQLQAELKRPYLLELTRQETELKKRKTALSLLEESIRALEQKIRTFKNDIVEVKVHPEIFGLDVDKKPKVQFYVGLAVLLPITLYLMVFYMSASYSAFFKNFEDTKIAAAIFDANAFGKAATEGWMEGIFIGTIPFAFMGLGYLIHMFQKQKGWTSYAKIGVLFAITFIFDSILAYQIEQKIYEFNRTPDSPDFNFSIAFTTVGFWGIIFAGFVVYIIWGLVFDFIMKEYENFDKVKSFIRGRKEEIKNSEKFIAENAKKIVDIKKEIAEIEGKINDLQRTIDGFVFSNKQYLTYHAEYVKGWFLAITDNFDALNRRDELLTKCEEEEKKHLEQHEINNEDFEGRIYKLLN